MSDKVTAIYTGHQAVFVPGQGRIEPGDEIEIHAHELEVRSDVKKKPAKRRKAPAKE